MEAPYYEFLQKFKKMRGYKKIRWDNDPENKNVAVLVEGRAQWHLPIVLRNFRHYLGDGWDLAVFHSAYNASYIADTLEDWEVQRYQVEDARITPSVFNGLMKNPDFWKTSDAEFVLLFQTDCIACKPLDDEWFAYDFVGAPCGVNGSTFNGGLSLRRRQTMLDAIEKYHWFLTDEQEDVWFSKALRLMDKPIPNGYDAGRFAVESWYYELPFGVHGTDKCYHAHTLAQRIAQQAIERLKGSK